MKIAFDVDVLAKQMDINRMVHQVADWGYKYIEQSPHPRINPFYKHPLFSRECEAEYRKALRETGVEISSFIVVYRWSGPTEEQRQIAVANWKRMIEIAVDMGVPVINTELSGDPNQQEICNGMWFRSMEELLPIIEREGLRVEIQSHPYDFCELNNETCDLVKSFRSPNLGYVYSSPHGFFYDEGKGDVPLHVTVRRGRTDPRTVCGYVQPDHGLPLYRQPAVVKRKRKSGCDNPPAFSHGRGRRGL